MFDLHVHYLRINSHVWLCCTCCVSRDLEMQLTYTCISEQLCFFLPTQEDIITGQGKFKYASGACYDGQWENGVYQVGAAMCVIEWLRD